MEVLLGATRFTADVLCVNARGLSRISYGEFVRCLELTSGCVSCYSGPLSIATKPYGILHCVLTFSKLISFTLSSLIVNHRWIVFPHGDTTNSHGTYEMKSGQRLAHINKKA